jgi:Tol biopolymer transport system component
MKGTCWVSRKGINVLFILLSIIIGFSHPISAQEAQQLLFSNGGQLTLINIDGSTSLNLSNSQSMDTQPDWSPDGSKIVFISDRLTPESEIMFRLRANLFIMNADGSEVRPLTEGNDQDTSPVFSLDGNKIVFVRVEADFDPPQPQIMMINVDGSGLESLAIASDGSPAGSLAWLPDGKSLTFSVFNQMDGTIRGVYTLDLDARTPVELPLDTSGVPIIAAGSAYALATDKVVFMRRAPALDTADTVGYEIVTRNADGSNEAVLLELPAPLDRDQMVREAYNFAWSPDGSWLAFETPDPRYKVPAFRQIAIMKADSTGLTLLTANDQGSAITPKWRPALP